MKQDTTADNKVLVNAASTTKSIGISSEAGRQPSIDASTVYAGIAGDDMRVYGLGDTCMLTIGSGGCTAGDELTSDSTGQGITTTTTGDYVGAKALVTANAGELARVEVVGYWRK